MCGNRPAHRLTTGLPPLALRNRSTRESQALSRLFQVDVDCLREGRSELRPTLTLEPCTYAGTLVVGRITSAVGRSVGHIGRASGGIPAPASITAHQPPVDPAGHDTERDGCGCSPEGFPNIGALHSRLYWCQSITLSSLIGLPPVYGYPSRGLKYVLCAVVTESYHPHNTGGNRLLREGLCLKDAAGSG